MTTARPLPLRLQDHLDQHIACTQALLALLDEEHAALSGNDIAALERISTVKASTADQLAQLSAQLARHCGTAPGPATDARIRAEGAGVAWDTLLDLARRAQDRNRRNGSLLTERERRTTRSLALLRGSQAVPLAYGRRGLASAVQGSRGLARA